MSHLLTFFSFDPIVFGYWHGVSLLATVLFNLLGTRMLHYYSSRMVNNIYLFKDGKHVEIEFMNAFMMPESRKYPVRDFGYMQPSRLFNVHMLTHKQKETLFINMSRNMYANKPEWNDLVSAIFRGKEVITTRAAP